MVEDVCFLYKVLLFYFLIAPFYRQTRIFFFICALTPFIHVSLLLLLLLLLRLLFFSFSLLNYNGRRHVFIYAEKVEEHIKTAIFISKIQEYSLLQRAHCFLCPTFCVFVLFWLCNGSIYFLACCMQRRWKNTLKLRFLSQKLHEYSFLQRAHCFICPAFCVFVLFWWCNRSIYFLACCMQRRWNNTLKLRFLSQKLHEYRFVRNGSAEGLFSLFLCLRFLYFFVSDNTKA
ncbi:hypothetical protein GmHk_18G051499 [Glycine max]|nr:hypothetical protein GmHk_18G051499 [Glycine max]